jgi:hypothetical protein
MRFGIKSCVSILAMSLSMAQMAQAQQAVEDFYKG